MRGLRSHGACLLVFTLAACSSQPIALSGEHRAAPAVQPTVVEIPVPPLAIGALAQGLIASEKLPEDTLKFSLLTFRSSLHYWPGLPNVSVAPEKISARIPYQYHFVREREDCHWQWQGIASGMRCTWNIQVDQTGVVNVGTDSKLRFTPVWDFELVTSPFFDGGNDVKPIAGKWLDGVAKKIDAEAKRLGAYSARVHETWTVMQTPLHVGGDVWLLIGPDDIWTTPLSASNDTLRFSVGLRAAPHIVYQDPGKVDAKPLPSWKEKDARGGAFDVSMQSRLPLSKARDLLMERLTKLEMPTRLGSVRVKNVSIAAVNDTMLVGVEVDSPFQRGWIYCKGQVEYLPLSEQFVTRNLRVTVDSANPLVRLFASLFRGDFETSLQQQAVWDGAGATRALVASAEQKFAELVGGRMSLSIFGIEPVVDAATGHQAIFTTPDSLNLAVRAQGRIAYRN